ncbi:MAG: D-alanyl-D-alanine carboxypeptidase family protein, partial [Acidimicrobiales bacterium]
LAGLGGTAARGGHGSTLSASSEKGVQVSLPRLTALVAATAPISGKLPAMPFPAKGEGAVAFSGTGVVAASPNERPVPIASETKIMTAYLVLQAHPLRGSEQGPTLTFTQSDHDAWMTYSENDLSNVELDKGEVLTERQLLEALLIPSADNVADILARWVGGTEARFVVKMNSAALLLGMTSTHYADASGVDPKTVSTASDQALLGSIMMRNPVFRSIVALNDVPFPVEGEITSYNPVLGYDGIIGVKSGFTQAAGGCLVAAAWRKVGDRRVLVVTSVTGQVLGLGQAGQADVALLNAATAHLQLVSPFGSTVKVASVSIPWSHSTVDASITGPVRVAGWGGLSFSSDLLGAPVTATNLHKGWPAGSVIGEFCVSSQFGPVGEYPVVIERAVAPPPAGSVVVRSPMSLGVGT